MDGKDSYLSVTVTALKLFNLCIYSVKLIWLWFLVSFTFRSTQIYIEFVCEKSKKQTNQNNNAKNENPNKTLNGKQKLKNKLFTHKHTCMDKLMSISETYANEQREKAN